MCRVPCCRGKRESSLVPGDTRHDAQEAADRIDACRASSDSPTHADAQERSFPMETVSDIQSVSPALERYLQGTLFGDLWNRPDLSARDRSIVTLAALIARNQAIELPSYVNLALDNGVTPSEISEIITHLGFYSGCANATCTTAILKTIFAQRGIGPDQLPEAAPQLLPLDQTAEDRRAATV